MYSKRRQPGGWHQLYLHFTPFAIAFRVGRFVAENVLVAQLSADLCRNVGHIRDIVHPEKLSSGLLAQVMQQQRTIALLGGSSIRIEDADGEQLSVRLADQVPHLVLRIAAAIVAAVGDDQDRFALVARLLHLVHAVIDGIEQSGAMPGPNRLQSRLDIVNRRSEVFDQLGTIVEADDEELVLWIGGAEEIR